MENNTLMSYPEGFMQMAQSLDFLEEEERVGFLYGFVLSAMMEV